VDDRSVFVERNIIFVDGVIIITINIIIITVNVPPTVLDSICANSSTTLPRLSRKK
jgi:hypothetical protein